MPLVAMQAKEDLNPNEYDFDLDEALTRMKIRAQEKQKSFGLALRRDRLIIDFGIRFNFDRHPYIFSQQKRC